MTRRKIVWAIVALLGGAATVFVGANAVDYYRYHSVIWRLEDLSDEQYRALGDAAARVTEPMRGDHAAGFEMLRPINVYLWPKSSDFLLYELKPAQPRYEEDHIYIYVRISTSPNNQEILYFTNSVGKQKQKILWNRNPEFVRKHSPRDRLLTITQSNGRGGRTWIILKDHILVIDDEGVVGGEPSIVGKVDLDGTGLARIRKALVNLPECARGKDYRADGVSDGISVGISFDPEGKESPDSISISNTWVEEFRPLLEAVSELGPKDCPIRFIEYMTTAEHLRQYPTTVRTMAEWDEISWGRLNAPWWSVWRKWLD